MGLVQPQETQPTRVLLLIIVERERDKGDEQRHDSRQSKSLITLYLIAYGYIDIIAALLLTYTISIRTGSRSMVTL